MYVLLNVSNHYRLATTATNRCHEKATKHQLALNATRIKEDRKIKQAGNHMYAFCIYMALYTITDFAHLD